MEEIRIFKIKSKHYWIVFIIILNVLQALMIASILVQNWVKITPKAAPGFEFEGSLFSVTHGFSEFPNPLLPSTTADLRGYYYIQLGCASNFLLQIWHEKSQTTEYNWDLFSALKKLFNNLWFAGGLYLVFEITSLISLLLLMLTLILLLKGNFFVKLNLCSSVCLWISHIIAIVGYLGYLDITFTDNCNDFINGENPPTLCATIGPKLAVFILVFLPFVMVPYFFVMHRFRKGAVLNQVSDLNLSSERNGTVIFTDNFNKGMTKEISFR